MVYIIHIQGEIGMFCTKCGAKNPEDATFCYKCGNEMYKTSEKLSDNSDKSPSVDFINDNRKASVSKNIEKEKVEDRKYKQNDTLLSWLTSFDGVMSIGSFWFAQLSLIILGVFVFFIDVSLVSTGVYNNTWLSWIYGIFYLFATISTDFRRLHDTNKSGAYILIGLIPVVGQIILLILLCLPRVEENNQWIEKQKEMLND